MKWWKNKNIDVQRTIDTFQVYNHCKQKVTNPRTIQGLDNNFEMIMIKYVSSSKLISSWYPLEFCWGSEAWRSEREEVREATPPTKRRLWRNANCSGSSMVCGKGGVSAHSSLKLGRNQCVSKEISARKGGSASLLGYQVIQKFFLCSPLLPLTIRSNWLHHKVGLGQSSVGSPLTLRPSLSKSQLVVHRTNLCLVASQCVDPK